MIQSFICKFVSQFFENLIRLTLILVWPRVTRNHWLQTPVVWDWRTGSSDRASKICMLKLQL
jgi:hypothetical protein